MYCVPLSARCAPRVKSKCLYHTHGYREGVVAGAHGQGCSSRHDSEHRSHYLHGHSVVTKFPPVDTHGGYTGSSTLDGCGLEDIRSKEPGPTVEELAVVTRPLLRSKLSTPAEGKQQSGKPALLPNPQDLPHTGTLPKDFYFSLHEAWEDPTALQYLSPTEFSCFTAQLSRFGAGIWIHTPRTAFCTQPWC